MVYVDDCHTNTICLGWRRAFAEWPDAVRATAAAGDHLPRPMCQVCHVQDYHNTGTTLLSLASQLFRISDIHKCTES